MGPPDPGSRRGALVAWILVVVMLGAVVGVNQLSGPPPKPDPAAEVMVTPPPGMDPVRMSAQMWVRLKGVLGAPPAQLAQGQGQIDDAARTPVDQFRAAIAAGELLGVAEAETRLAALEADLRDSGAPGLQEDAAVYRRSLETDIASLDPGDEARLVERHGWFGQLAAARGLPDSDAKRAAVVGSGAQLIAIIALIGLVMIVGLLGALVAGIFMIVRLSQRTIHPTFVRPSPGGSVYLESVGVFIAGFLLLRLGMSGLALLFDSSPRWLGAVQLGMQWLLVILTLYPLVRGVRWKELRQDMGWHSGKGVWREVGAGLFGYFAGLWLLIVAAAITVGILAVRSMVEGPDAAPPQNPIAEVLTSAGPLELFLLFTLATIWAPLVEESVFRGAFYRHLRSRLGMALAVVVSALGFGLMHGYALFLLLPVISLGMAFALIREWRGSLIGPMVAHGLHNATILTLASLLLGQFKD